MAKQRVRMQPIARDIGVLAAKIDKKRLARNLASRKYRAKKRAERMAETTPEIVESEDETVGVEDESTADEDETVASEFEPEPEDEDESVASEFEPEPEDEEEQEEPADEDVAAARLAAAVKPAPTISVYDALNRTVPALPLRPAPKKGDMWPGALHPDKSLNAAEKLERAPTMTIEMGTRLAVEVEEVEDLDLGVLEGEYRFFKREMEAIMAAWEVDKRMEEERKGKMAEGEEEEG